MNESFIQDEQKPNASSRRNGPKRSAEKQNAIAAAACHVLARNGPRLTQVADVARAAGVASGTVYLYAAEKDALTELALLYAARFDLPAPREPVRFSGARLKKTALRALEERLNWPILRAAIQDGAPTPDTLAAILSEAYDLLAREHRLIALFDRCSSEIAILETLYIKGQRRAYLRDFEACLDRLAQAGFVRRDLDMAAASRAALEMMVWMAMRRTGDPDPPACDAAAARSASIGLLLTGLTEKQHFSSVCDTGEQ